MDSPTREGTILDLVLGNEPGLATGVSMEEHSGDNDHNSTNFKIVLTTKRSVGRLLICKNSLCVKRREREDCMGSLQFF